MDHPAGRPMLLIFLFALLGAAGMIAIWPGAKSPDDLVWVFDPTHLQTYTQPTDDAPALTEIYKRQTGRSAGAELIASRALDARLLSLILSGAHGAEVPDLVEIEIGSVGKYFRATPERNGLMPLDEFIAGDARARQLLPARLATWSHDGKVFGIPRDVHAVTITYRHDLFAQAGVDLSACQTWDALRDACLKYQRYWRDRGQDRLAIQLSRWNASDLMILLCQQHIGIVQEDGGVQINDSRIARTIAFYAQLVEGPDAISTQVTTNSSTEDLADGHTAALLTPDWRVSYLRSDARLIGKLRMMPLPRFAPGDARTASWGGTMVAIPRNCRDPQQSWKLLHALQLSGEAMKARAYHSSILPAMTSAWADAAWDRPDALYGGQPIGRLYADLAQELPVQRISPYTALISQMLAGVLAGAQSHLRSSGAANLEGYCATELAAAQVRLDRLLRFAQDAEQIKHPEGMP